MSVRLVIGISGQVGEGETREEGGKGERCGIGGKGVGVSGGDWRGVDTRDVNSIIGLGLFVSLTS